jgi:hypothetical protein
MCQVPTQQQGNRSDPIWYWLIYWIGSLDEKLGDWIAHPIQCPGYWIATDSIGAQGIRIALQYQSVIYGINSKCKFVTQEKFCIDFFISFAIIKK